MIGGMKSAQASIACCALLLLGSVNLSGALPEEALAIIGKESHRVVETTLNNLEETLDKAIASLAPAIVVTGKNLMQSGIKKTLEDALVFESCKGYKLYIFDQGPAIITLQYRDSAKMLAAARRPELEQRLTSRERKALQAARSRIAACTTSAMSDYEKVKALHDDLVQRTTSGIDGDTCDALLLRRGMCEGYSQALWLMLRLCDVPCRIVQGKAKSNHSWNLVSIGGAWYHIDPTWDDPLGGAPHISRDFFCINDEAIAPTHRWDRRLYPACRGELSRYLLDPSAHAPSSAAEFWLMAQKAYEQGYPDYEAVADFRGSKGQKLYRAFKRLEGLPPHLPVRLFTPPSSTVYGSVILRFRR